MSKLVSAKADHNRNHYFFARTQTLPGQIERSGAAFGIVAWVRALLGLDKSPWENSGPTV